MKANISSATKFARKPVVAALAAAVTLGAPFAAHAWEPTKTVEFIVPAGSGGGADQMARFLQGVIGKNDLMDQNMVVINKAGGAGAEGFLYMKAAAGDPHKISLTLSNLFTTPLATGVPFNWKDLTPVEMLALDQFILMTNAEKGYANAQEFLDAAKEAADGGKPFRLGGTGAKQEDQIIQVALSKQTDTPMTYVPYSGGGEVNTQLVGNHIDATVNNPLEGVSNWRGGKINMQCIFDSERSEYDHEVTPDGQAWSDIPTCQEEGIDVTYQMLRGIFTTPGASDEVVAYYNDLFDKVRETKEWKEFMQNGAFNQTNLKGEEFVEWLEENEKMHRELMEEAGFLAK